MRKRNIIIAAIILMAVGFATLTTNLIINGNTTVSNNKEDYDIRFTKTILEGNENNSLIGNNGKEITYETSTLTNVGDKSELVYEISNNSSQYDAEVSISCVPTSTITHTSYYTINTSNTPETIKAKRSARGSIIVTLTKLSTENFKENFKCTLNINAVERTSIGKPIYKEEQLNGTDPVVKEGLIPVTLSSDGTVTMADTSEEWYDYGNKEWANAVILVENPSKEYQINDIIEETDIESYFVWIPKYKYRLWNVNSTEENIGKHSIEIKFGIEDTTDIEGESCATPMVSGESGNCNNGEYMTHPAFISFDVNGFWVGKFVNGYKDAKSAASAEQKNAEPSNIIIKPNVYSWRGNTVYNMFMASYNYNRNLRSHMMKNTEWGAVAYFSHSIYGINEEIRINNNSNYLTGYASNEENASGNATNNQAYNTEIGHLASTTGNITGIYDMSGGPSEYLSSYIKENVGASDFTNETITNSDFALYFDTYSSLSERTLYQYRILGDATGELGPFKQYADADNVTRPHNNWYTDFSAFVDSKYPWFIRGGIYNDGSLAGQLTFNRDAGGVSSTIGSRLVLSLT